MVQAVEGKTGDCSSLDCGGDHSGNDQRTSPEEHEAPNCGETLVFYSTYGDIFNVIWIKARVLCPFSKESAWRKLGNFHQIGTKAGGMCYPIFGEGKCHHCTHPMCPMYDGEPRPWDDLTELNTLTTAVEMVALFTNKTLIVNNKDNDELVVERELTWVLENKVMLLYFGSGECPRCQEFVPILKEFFVKLTDEFYVERSSQLVLIYVSLDETEKKQDKFLKKMPKKWLFLPFLDEFKKELELRFCVTDPPVVVVLKPNGEVIAANAVEEIKQMGTDCFQNWREAADLVDRNFLLAQDFDNVAWRSITDPLRRLKYKLKKKKRKRRSNEEEEKEDEDEDADEPS